MLFVTRRKFEKMTLDILKEIIDYQFETFVTDTDNLDKLNQQKGAIIALLILAKKIESKKWI